MVVVSTLSRRQLLLALSQNQLIQVSITRKSERTQRKGCRHWRWTGLIWRASNSEEDGEEEQREGRASHSSVRCLRYKENCLFRSSGKVLRGLCPFKRIRRTYLEELQAQEEQAINISQSFAQLSVSLVAIPKSWEFNLKKPHILNRTGKLEPKAWIFPTRPSPNLSNLPLLLLLPFKQLVSHQMTSSPVTELQSKGDIKF